jgi:hypothetical protein
MLRLRKQLGFTQHEVKARKAIFVKKQVTAELVKEDARYLQIQIFKCESDWAYAMMLKQRTTQKSAKFNPNRARVHSIKRFKRACQNVRQLAVDWLDNMSQLEIEAYQLQIEASYYIEVQEYAKALDMLLKAKFIYEKVAATKDELDQAIYQERCSHIDTFIRLCSSQLSSGV